MAKVKMSFAEALAALALGLLELPLDGWVFKHLWRWFVVPLGVADIGVWAGAGIMCCARFITAPRNGSNDWSFEEAIGKLIGSAIFVLLMLAVGWLCWRMSQ